VSVSTQWSQHDLVRPVTRYWRRAFAVFLLVVVAAAAAATLWPKKYESESKLFVRVGRENAALDPTATTGQVIALNVSRETEINSIVEHLGSRYIFEQAITRIDPEFSTLPSDAREAALQKFMRSIVIESPRHSTIVTVKCKARSPEAAQQAVAAVVDVYLDEHMRINRTNGSHEFFAEQVGLLETQLNAAQAELRDAKNKVGFSSLEERRKSLETQASSIETQAQQVVAALSASRAKLATLESELHQLPQTLASQLVGGTPNDGLAGMREQLFRLRAHEKELLAKYTPEHPHAIAVRREVQEVEAALKSEMPRPEQTTTAVLAQEKANRDALIAQERSLAVQLKDVRSRIVEFNEQETSIAALTRQVNQLESRYLAYQGDSEQARMDLALQKDRITNVSVVQPASYEPAPVSPKKSILLALAVLLGTSGGLAVAFLSEWLATAATNGDDVRRNRRLPALNQMAREAVSAAAQL